MKLDLETLLTIRDLAEREKRNFEWVGINSGISVKKELTELEKLEKRKTNKYYNSLCKFVEFVDNIEVEL